MSSRPPDPDEEPSDDAQEPEDHADEVDPVESNELELLPDTDELEAAAAGAIAAGAVAGGPAEGGDEGEGEVDEDADPPEEEEVEEIEFATAKIASEKELRAALAWAFESEEDADDALLDRFARHARMVLEAALHMNITKIIEPKDVAAKHYLDSWRSTRLMPLLGKTLVDIGSGAGFPGIPVAMCEPNTRVILIDSNSQKAAFLQEVVDALALKNVTVIDDKAEEHLARNRYDVGIMRAMSSVRENVRLLRKVRHSVKDLMMLKGPSWSREVRAGEREAERLGFRLDTVWEHELPGGLGQRAVLVYAAPGGQGL